MQHTVYYLPYQYAYYLYTVSYTSQVGSTVPQGVLHASVGARTHVGAGCANNSGKQLGRVQWCGCWCQAIPVAVGREAEWEAIVAVGAVALSGGGPALVAKGAMAGRTAVAAAAGAVFKRDVSTAVLCLAACSAGAPCGQ